MKTKTIEIDNREISLTATGSGNTEIEISDTGSLILTPAELEKLIDFLVDWRIAQKEEAKECSKT